MRIKLLLANADGAMPVWSGCPPAGRPRCGCACNIGTERAGWFLRKRTFLVWLR